jgi:hypothetical protein
VTTRYIYLLRALSGSYVVQVGNMRKAKSATWRTAFRVIHASGVDTRQANALAKRMVRQKFVQPNGKHNIPAQRNGTKKVCLQTYKYREGYGPADVGNWLAKELSGVEYDFAIATTAFLMEAL